MKTAERTIERPRVERVVEPQPSRRSWLITLVVAVVALAVGLAGGYLLWGSDDVDPTAPVTVDGVELTGRQERMVELVDEYVAAWQRGDGAAVESMFTDNGVLDIFGTTRSAADGAIADYVDEAPAPSLSLEEPVLIDGSEMLNFHTLDGFTNYANAMTFTSTGDVLIVRHEIVR